MAEVKLSDFIESTLVEIAAGVRAANKRLMDPDNEQFQVFVMHQNVGAAGKVPGIKFDVAITAGNKQKDSAGFVVALLNVGAGANTEKSKDHEAAHRVQFEVGIQSKWE